MKKLMKLNINPEKVIGKEELMSIRGGFGVMVCYRDWIQGGDCQFAGDDMLCDDNDRLFCIFMCPGSWGSICVGGEGY